MSSLAISTLLEEYKTQRKYREARRNQFLRRFEVLKQTFAHVHHSHEVPAHHSHSHPHVEIQQTHQHHPHPIRQEPVASHVHHNHQETLHNRVSEQTHHHQEQVHNNNHEKARLEEEESLLHRENQALKAALVEIETSEKEKLLGFKAEIENVKGKYMEEVHKLSETAKNGKEQVELKMNKIKQQSDLATKKNTEILNTNKSLKAQIEEGNSLMGKYSTEIKQEYAQKINEFEKIFNSSNEKIEAMEREFNEDQFIQNTLKNEQLLQSIEENAQKAEEAGKILEDYGTLLEGKKQILTEINSNVAMKEKQIEKMVELEGKMKLIMDKLTQEKRIYVAENNKMAQELIEIKSLLMGAINETK